MDNKVYWNPTEIVTIDSYIGKYLREFKSGLDSSYHLDVFPIAVVYYTRTLVDMVYKLSDSYIMGKAIHPVLLMDIRDVMEYIVVKSGSNSRVLEDTSKIYSSIRNRRSKQGLTGGIKRAFVELVMPDFYKD